MKKEDASAPVGAKGRAVANRVLMGSVCPTEQIALMPQPRCAGSPTALS